MRSGPGEPASRHVSALPIAVVHSPFTTYFRAAAVIRPESLQGAQAELGRGTLESKWIGIKAEPPHNLLQTFDQVEVTERSMKTINVGFSVWGHLDRSDGGDAGRIQRDNLFLTTFFPVAKSNW